MYHAPEVKEKTLEELTCDWEYLTRETDEILVELDTEDRAQRRIEMGLVYDEDFDLLAQLSKAVNDLVRRRVAPLLHKGDVPERAHAVSKAVLQKAQHMIEQGVEAIEQDVIKGRIKDE